jgi:hypothetical protein
MGGVYGNKVQTIFQCCFGIALTRCLISMFRHIAISDFFSTKQKTSAVETIFAYFPQLKSCYV